MSRPCIWQGSSSRLRSSLGPLSWRIYGHLSPIQLSRGEAWAGASQVQAMLRATSGERGFHVGEGQPEGWVRRAERIWRALEVSLDLGGEMKFGRWSICTVASHSGVPPFANVFYPRPFLHPVCPTFKEIFLDWPSFHQGSSLCEDKDSLTYREVIVVMCQLASNGL